MIDVPVQVKDILRDGRKKKNFRINVLKTDGTLDFVIGNDALVSETVAFDERMCSGDTIKFGLCEGSSLEFQYFDHPNITGRRLQVFIDITYGTDQTCSIPMGYFTVEKCSRQASTGIIKVTAYNKLKSEYLDQKANGLLQETFSSDYLLTMFDIKHALLSDYEVEEARGALTPTERQPQTYNMAIPNFRFTALYGIDSPINAYEFGVSSTSTDFDLELIFTKHTWDRGFLTYPDAFPDAAFGVLEALERNIVDFIKKLVDDAHLNKTGDEVIDWICANEGFQNIVGIGASTSIAHPPYTLYSTVQWEYEEQNNIAHTVAGRLVDAQRISSNYYAFQCAAPTSFGNVIFNGEIKDTPNNRNYYEYYLDSEMSDLGRSAAPYLTYSNGTIYDEQAQFPIQIYSYSDLPDADKITSTISSLPDFTLRELITATYETECQFGRLNRETDLFDGIELNGSRLFPADTLYPDTSLYPLGAAMSSERSMYSKLWGDEGNIQKWRYLIITYKGLDSDNKEKDFKLQKTINTDGTCDYNMSDNWLFKNLVWNAADVEDYADAMASKMQDVTWFPFEMWCAGLPYIETGDEIEITIKNVAYTSYVLQRQLKGLQNLQDTYINGTLDIF